MWELETPLAMLVLDSEDPARFLDQFVDTHLPRNVIGDGTKRLIKMLLQPGKTSPSLFLVLSNNKPSQTMGMLSASLSCFSSDTPLERLLSQLLEYVKRSVYKLHQL